MSMLSNWSMSQAEAQFDYSVNRAWMQENWKISIIIAAIYMAAVFLGQIFMQRFPALNVRKLLFTWNLCLAVFSFTGLSKVHSEFVGSIQHHGLRGSYCLTNNYYNNEVGYWVWLFHMSKLVELVDTLLLVVRKRPVIFLHWFHHATVLVCSWYTYPYGAASIRWGTWMNLIVHSVMYSYFALCSLGIRLPRGVSMAITTLQISQFAVGMCVCADVFNLVMIKGAPCDVPANVAVWQSVLYLSYLVIFCKYFYKTYMTPRAPKIEKSD